MGIRQLLRALTYKPVQPGTRVQITARLWHGQGATVGEYAGDGDYWLLIDGEEIEVPMNEQSFVVTENKK